MNNQESNDVGKATGEWFAGHLYYDEPWEVFLTDAVKPFIEDVSSHSLAEGYFFIRYWERGPHIRLRFRGNAEVLEEQLKPMFQEYFHDYFRDHPSQRKPIEGMEKWAEAQRFYPDNSVQFIQYQPEVDRYGGAEGIGIAERQFQCSTDAVLAIIAESEGWDYNRALGAAIQLHLGFIFAVGMDITEAIAFFTWISRIWLSRTYRFSADLSREELSQRRETVLNAFKENFLKQQSVLVPYHETLWGAFTDGVEFEQEWLNKWVTGIQGISARLETALLENRIIVPAWFQSLFAPGELSEKIPADARKLWPILESYVHMTNNRLGILNRDEAYLGYLIKESLKCNV